MPRVKLSDLSIVQLKAEIARRQKLLPKLIAQRDVLDREIASLQGLDASVAASGTELTTKKARKSRRAKNKMNLVDALASVMQGKEKVSVREAMEAALTAGYRTQAKNFRSVVNNAMFTNDRFKRVGRGEFSLKK